VFREVNLRILATLRSMEAADGELDLLCECALVHCTERFSLAASEYEAVLAKRGAILVVPGHERASDRVLADAGGYLVVRPGRRQ
jgi:hypothetical protein